MSGGSLASAVILPEPDGQTNSPPRPRKRRPSTISDASPKRTRTTHSPSKIKSDDVTPPIPAKQDPQPGRQKASGQMEERKRGQRLFGALLGTLSQSSSSTAQKRRSDIEKKQQAKLRLQAEEQDDKKKQKLEALMLVRRREQCIYDKQSMQIRHSNLVSQAHFLQTKSAPILFYKPWETTREEDEKMRQQVKGVEEMVEKEISQYSPKLEELPPKVEEEQMVKQPRHRSVEKEMALVDGSNKQEPKSLVGNLSDIADTKGHETQDHGADLLENSKDTGDDGGEVVEGEEDTVIY